MKFNFMFSGQVVALDKCVVVALLSLVKDEDCLALLNIVAPSVDGKALSTFIRASFELDDGMEPVRDVYTRSVSFLGTTN